MKIPIEAIRDLRNATFASVADCKKALQESGADMQKAIEYLRRHGLEVAAKKQSRHAKEGRVEAYVHLGSKIGVLVEIDCETDFVAKNSDFCQFSKDIAMQIAACNPSYIKKEDVPKEEIEKHKDKDKFLKENCLLEQVFIKDANMTVNDYLVSLIARMGENIVIRRFTRYKIGE